MMRRAEITKAGVRFASDLLGKCRREPRLANARLAGDQYDPSFAALRLLPAAKQEVDFLITPDERRLPRTQRLEPADEAALANNAPAVLRLGETGKLPSTEILKLEQGAELPPCRIGDDKAV